MASDTMPGPHAAAEASRAIEAREVDLIIGTQIVAKGWHFPHLTLVGVVDADLGLAGGDLRAAERTVQLLHQVAGRAGRAEAPGRVLLQTFSPEHPVMQALVAGDLAAFMAQRGGAAAARPLAALRPAGGADRQRRYGRGGGRAGARPRPGGAARRRRGGAGPGAGAAGDPARAAPAAAAAEDAARCRGAADPARVAGEGAGAARRAGGGGCRSGVVPVARFH